MRPRPSSPEALQGRTATQLDAPARPLLPVHLLTDDRGRVGTRRTMDTRRSPKTMLHDRLLAPAASFVSWSTVAAGGCGGERNDFGQTPT